MFIQKALSMWGNVSRHNVTIWGETSLEVTDSYNNEIIIIIIIIIIITLIFGPEIDGAGTQA